LAEHRGLGPFAIDCNYLERSSIVYVSRLFVWSQNEDSGYDGWLMQQPSAQRLSGFEPAGNFNPYTGGRVLAHDVIEHFSIPTDRDFYENEMMALGQIAWLRLEYGHWESETVVSKGEDPGQILGRIVFDAMMDNWRSNDRYSIPRCRFRHPRDEWLHETCLVALQEAERILPGEYKSWHSDNDEEGLSEEAAQLLDCMDWVKHGYHRARARWTKGRQAAQGWDERSLQIRGDEMFWELAAKIDAVTKGDDPQHGDKLRVGFTLKNFDTAVRFERMGEYY
jgi:hypothetical protein